jgi:hypothetical protein
MLEWAVQQLAAVMAWPLVEEAAMQVVSAHSVPSTRSHQSSEGDPLHWELDTSLHSVAESSPHPIYLMGSPRCLGQSHIWRVGVRKRTPAEFRNPLVKVITVFGTPVRDGCASRRYGHYQDQYSHSSSATLLMSGPPAR